MCFQILNFSYLRWVMNERVWHMRDSPLRCPSILYTLEAGLDALRCPSILCTLEAGLDALRCPSILCTLEAGLDALRCSSILCTLEAGLDALRCPSILCTLEAGLDALEFWRGGPWTHLNWNKWVPGHSKSWSMCVPYTVCLVVTCLSVFLCRFDE